MGRVDAIIIGAGPGGLSAALALKQANIKPLVYERATSGREAGIAVTLWPNAMRALDRLGLGDRIRQITVPFDGIGMALQDGRELFRIDRATFTTRFGECGLAIRRTELVNLLRAKLGEEYLRFDTLCVAVEPTADGARARFVDGTNMEAPLLIGADGMDSVVRRSLFGDQQLHAFGCAVWRGIAQMRLRDRTARIVLGRGTQFGRFPLSGDHVYWFASAVATARDAHHDGRKLLERFKDWEEEAKSLITCTAPEDIVHTQIYDMDPLPAWSRGGATLLGDAAHVAAPDLGQGACQAIEDAVVLGRSIAAAPDFRAGLKDYERRRRSRTRRMTLLSRRIARSGSYTSALACTLRNRVIAMTPMALRLRQLKTIFEFAS